MYLRINLNNKMIRKILCLAVVCANIFFSGCATDQRTNYSVFVNGLAKQSDSSKSKFFLYSGDNSVKETSLQFQEYASYVKRALIDRGFKPSANAQDADIAVFVAYGNSEPKEHVYSYRTPNFGQTGVSGSTTYGNVTGSATSIGDITYGTADYTETTTYTPTYGITGYSSNVGTYTTFTRHIHIWAVDMWKYFYKAKFEEEWETTIISTGSSSDLRSVFPFMLAAASPYLATNTGERVSVDIYEDDPRVTAIRSGEAIFEIEVQPDPSELQYE
jgi:hypothetical protein